MPGLLSGFFAYLYTWYCFSALFSLESRMQPIPLEAFYSGLGLHVDTVPAVQVFKNRSFMGGLSPSSLWTRSLPVVLILFVSGSRWVLWWWVSDGIGGGMRVCLRDMGAHSSRRSLQGSKGC